MSEKLKMMLSMFLILLLLPYIITYAMQGTALFTLDAVDVRDAAQENHVQSPQTVSKQAEPTELLTGILAGQIRMDAPREAIRAQAVLVRTEYMRRQQTGEKQEQPLSVDELTRRWGSQKVKEFYGIAQGAVLDTAGEILTYEGQPIQAAYHKVSAGSTRAVAAINEEATPYLQSVSCGMDITSEDYLYVRFFSAAEVQVNLALEEMPDFSALSLKADCAGYVETVQLGAAEVSGDTFRELFGLASPCFYLKEVDGKLRAVGKGKGHGIGMSQYAAEKQAESGASYSEILAYFFPGTVLQADFFV